MGRYKGLHVGNMKTPIELIEFEEVQTVQGNIVLQEKNTFQVVADRRETRGNEKEFKGMEDFVQYFQYTIHYNPNINEKLWRVKDLRNNQEYKILFKESIGYDQGLRLHCQSLKEGN